MLLFNNFEIGNPYLLHTPRTNYKTNVQIPKGGGKNNEKNPGIWSLASFRMAKGE